MNELDLLYKLDQYLFEFELRLRALRDKLNEHTILHVSN